MSKQLRRVSLVGLAIVTILAPGLLSGSVQAEAQDTRVVDRSSLKMPTLASQKSLQLRQEVTVRGTLPLPNGVTLGNGESVRVVYSDGEVLYQADKSGCVKTYGANSLSGGRPVTAGHSLGIGSGCSSSAGTTGYLWAYDGWLWGYQLKASKYSGLVPVGNTRYFFSQYYCDDPHTTDWKNRTGSPTEAEISGSRSCS